MSLTDHTAFPPTGAEQEIEILKGFLAQAMFKSKMFVAFQGSFEERAARLMNDGSSLPTEIHGWHDFWKKQAEKRFKA